MAQKFCFEPPSLRTEYMITTFLLTKRRRCGPSTSLSLAKDDIRRSKADVRKTWSGHPPSPFSLFVTVSFEAKATEANEIGGLGPYQKTGEIGSSCRTLGWC